MTKNMRTLTSTLSATSRHGLRLGLAVLPLLAGCHDGKSSTTGTGGNPGTNDGSIFGRLDSLGLTTLRATLEAGGYEALLRGPGPFTLIAPTNAAFAALPAGRLGELMQSGNAVQLEAFLDYHILPGDQSSANVSGLSAVVSREGSEIIVEEVISELYLNSAAVTTADELATNGRIHIVDRVLWLPTDVMSLLQSQGFTTLVQAIEAAGLTGAINGAVYTILAPTNQAFAALPPGELQALLDPANQAELVAKLQYHMIPGRSLMGDLLGQGANGSLEGPLQFFETTPSGPECSSVPISVFNQPATDGLIHTLDGVMTIPGNIIEVLEANGFTTLVAAIEAGGLTDTYRFGGPWTIFAPSEQAFSALPAGALASLLEPANMPALVELLQYHTLTSAQTYSQLAVVASVTSWLGLPIMIQKQPTGMILNGSARLDPGDLWASNGIIHTLDMVLDPGK